MGKFDVKAVSGGVRRDVRGGENVTRGGMDGDGGWRRKFEEGVGAGWRKVERPASTRIARGDHPF